MRLYTHTHTHTDNFRERGITLVALVVTIVVLLILAGVSINMVLGENGIVTKAKDARDQTKQAQANELQDLDSMASAIDEILSDNGSGSGTGSGTGDGSETKVPEAATTETAPYFPDSTFTKKEGTIDTGLVIQDAEGNEYVWVVVPRTKEVYGTTDLGKTTFTDADYASIETDLKNYTSTYRGSTNNSDTWDADTDNVGWLTSDEYTELKNNMLKSVYLNGGFYVGRYEAGIETTGTNRTSNTDKNSDNKYTTPTTAPVTKADAYPYTYVTRTQAQNLAKNVNSGDYTSSLMFGVQWDLVLAFMAKDTNKITSTTVLTADSTSIGNYYNASFSLNRGQYITVADFKKWYKITESNSNGAVVNKEKLNGSTSGKPPVLLTTGATEYSNVMNIYDIAGNIWKWTLEEALSTDSHCAYRGGSFEHAGSSYSASYRNGIITTTSNYYLGFRVSLF